MIEEDKPRFIGITEILQISVQNTMWLLKRELEIEKEELEEQWHWASLEKYFIENKIYRKIEGSASEDDMVDVIDKGLAAFKKKLKRNVTREDIIRLSEIPFKRTTKFNSFKADEQIKDIEEKIEQINLSLEQIIQYTIDWYKKIKKKYGTGRERRTEIRSFDEIEAVRVVANNVRLYINKEEGFIGTSLKKDEFLFECSDIDNILFFRRNGTYMITRVAEKTFIGKDVIHVTIFFKNDERTIYNIVYRDGKYGNAMIKRCAVTSLILDKEYDMTKGAESSKIIYFSANPNGEAEIIKVMLKPKPMMKKLFFEQDFSKIDIKGRGAIGNILTKHEIHKIVLKEQGVSTLGGIKIWFDRYVMRLNTEDHGDYIGEFLGGDKILIFTESDCYRITNFDLSNHYEEDLLIIEKYDPKKIWTAIHFEGETGETYIKRFQIEETDKLCSFIGDHPESKYITINDDKYPQLELTFGGKYKKRDSEVINVAEFIGIKSYKAKGKRISPFEVAEVSFIEPLIVEEEPAPKSENNNTNHLPNIKEMIKKDGNDPLQMTLF